MARKSFAKGPRSKLAALVTAAASELFCGCTSSARPSGAGTIGDASAGAQQDAKPAPDGSSVDPAHSKMLTLRFTPEDIAPESDPGLDQIGFFRVEVFARPDPPPGDAAS